MKLSTVLTINYPETNSMDWLFIECIRLIYLFIMTQKKLVFDNLSVVEYIFMTQCFRPTM